jgi:hypothetical protein
VFTSSPPPRLSIYGSYERSGHPGRGRRLRAASWIALGLQWRPAATGASFLSPQLIEGLIEACEWRRRQQVSQLVAA